MLDSALLQYTQVRMLGLANDGDLEYLRQWLERGDGGHFFLRGREALIWGIENSNDLVGVAPRCSEGKDYASRWLADKMCRWFHRKIGYRIKARSSENGIYWNEN